MRKSKKALALLLTTAMIASLGACGKKDTDNDTKSTPTPQTQDQDKNTTPEATPETTPNEPKYDFGGRVLKIGSYYDMTL